MAYKKTHRVRRRTKYQKRRSLKRKSVKSIKGTKRRGGGGPGDLPELPEVVLNEYYKNQALGYKDRVFTINRDDNLDPGWKMHLNELDHPVVSLERSEPFKILMSKPDNPTVYVSFEDLNAVNDWFNPPVVVLEKYYKNNVLLDYTDREFKIMRGDKIEPGWKMHLKDHHPVIDSDLQKILMSKPDIPTVYVSFKDLNAHNLWFNPEVDLEIIYKEDYYKNQALDYTDREFKIMHGGKLEPGWKIDVHYGKPVVRVERSKPPKIVMYNTIGGIFVSVSFEELAQNNVWFKINLNHPSLESSAKP